MAQEWLRQYSQTQFETRPSFHFCHGSDNNAESVDLFKERKQNGHKDPEQLVRELNLPNEEFEDYGEDEETPQAETAILVDDAPSAPIDVPVRPRDDRCYSQAVSSASGSTDYSLSSLQESFANRTKSIGFNSKVRLENNSETSLKGPPKLSVRTRPRGRSMMDMIANQKQDFKSRSQAEDSAHDHTADEHANDRHRPAENGHCFSSLPSECPNQNGQSLDTNQNELERNGLPTSRSTLSTHPEEHTGSSSGNVASPLSTSSPAREWFGSASQELPRRVSMRSKSYVIDRPGGSSRRPSRRSTAASSASPASAFLQKYLPSSPLPEPDDEGQEVGDYVLGRRIGSGGFSVIREAFTLSGSERMACAVKIVRHSIAGADESDNDILQAQFEHEVEIWRSLSHPHVLPLVAVYNTDFATFAFMKLNTGGTLFDLVRSNRSGFEPRLARLYAAQLATALRYLHEDARIVHRDLKLENCLIDMTATDAAETGGRLLLCDFGLAEYYNSDNVPNLAPNSQTGAFGLSKASTYPPATAKQERPRNSQESQTQSLGSSETSLELAGTLEYAAPELLENRTGSLNTQIDIWAFGVISFALIMGKLPFKHKLASSLRTMIMGGEWDREALRAREGYTNSSTPQTAMQDNHYFEDRGKIQENGNTPALIGISELIEGCLTLDPPMRWDVQDLLLSTWLREECEKIEDND